MWQNLAKQMDQNQKHNREHRARALRAYARAVSESSALWILFSTFSFAFGLLAVVLLNNGWSAPIDLKESWRSSPCNQKISQVFLSGDFVLPGAPLGKNSQWGSEMSLWVGRKSSGTEPVAGVITNRATGSCEAVCSVSRFERYLKDRAPAMLVMECTSSRLSAMTMPLQIVWDREQKPTLRMGSVLYGVEETKLTIAVNRYAAPDKSVVASH